VTTDPTGWPLDRRELVDRFASFPGRLADAARAADGRPVPAGQWTPELVVRHLIAVEGEVWRARLAELAAGGEPRWSWVEPGPAPGYPDASVDDVLDVMVGLRSGTVDLLRIFDLDDVGWARAGIHETYGRLDVAGLLRLAIGHDEEHLAGLTASA
jgi:hypothetical protein